MKNLKEINEEKFKKMFPDAEIKETKECFYKWVNEQKKFKTLIFWKHNGRISERRNHSKPFFVHPKE